MNTVHGPAISYLYATKSWAIQTTLQVRNWFYARTTEVYSKPDDECVARVHNDHRNSLLRRRIL